jgi:SIR2-like protein
MRRPEDRCRQRSAAIATPLTQSADTAGVVQLIGDVVKKGQCVLFLGAGIHAPPPEGDRFVYPPAVRPPLGTALSEHLAAQLGSLLEEELPNEDPRNLQRVALFYEMQRSRRQLVDEIRARVQDGKQPSPAVRALAQLGFPLIITTNYDQLFEQALVLAGRQPRVSVYTPELETTVDYRDPSPESPVVFKIHGDIARPETIVVTDEDYIQFVLRMSNKDPFDPLPLTVKYHMTAWTTLFVGYSMLDYNLRLLFKSLRWKIDTANIPDMYSVDRTPDPLILNVWHNQRRYVRFIAEDVWAFVPDLYRNVLGKEMPDYAIA